MLLRASSLALVAACNFSPLVGSGRDDGEVEITSDCGGTCNAGETCTFGKCLCDPASCRGCCASERCLVGTEPDACGKNGAACSSCDDLIDGPICAEQRCSCLSHAHCANSLNGPFCVNGRCGCAETANCPEGQACTGDSVCRSTGCDAQHPCNGGCCTGSADDARCVPSCETGLACGADGLCPSACSATATCTAGCCADDGTCKSGAEPTACGGGGQCRSCLDAEEGSVCRQGQCGCSVASDCVSSTDGGACNQATQRCGCGTAADCAPGNACTVDGVCRPTGCDNEHPCRDGCCSAGVCTAGTDTNACGDDGFECATCIGACSGGQCTCLDADDCPTPSNPCTPQKSCDDGVCNASDGGFTGPCGAALGCAAAPLCSGGACQPRAQTPGSCPGATYCLAKVCDLSNGQCINVFDHEGLSCDDSNACTYGDTCGSATCGGTVVTCTGDYDQCNFNICNGTSSCAPSPKDNTTVCNDNNDATYNDVCTNGVCGGTPISCTGGGECFNWVANGTATCAKQWNGQTSCTDGDLCTYGDQCGGTTTCTGTSISCTGSYDQCNDRACNGTSTCGPTPKSDGISCSDSNLCTYGDRCVGGACSPTGSVSCNASTCETCDGTSTCAVMGCFDGSSCQPGTTNEACGSGVCMACDTANGWICGFGGCYCSSLPAFPCPF